MTNFLKVSKKFWEKNTFPKSGFYKKILEKNAFPKSGFYKKLLVFICMKLTSLIKEEYMKLINEGISDIVYHFTYTGRLTNILKTNKFSLATNLGSTADSNIDKGYPFFFSTQRSGGKTGYGSKTGNAYLVLDGRKLSHNHKGAPIDYWSWSKKRSDYDNDSTYMNALQSNELEDRIISKKPFIDNAKSYIKEIHILIENYTKQESIEEIIKYKDNIPIYFYTDENSYRLGNKKNAVKDINAMVNNLERSDISYERDETVNFKWLVQKLGAIISIDGNPQILKKLDNLISEVSNNYDKEGLYPHLINKIKDQKELWEMKRYSQWDDFYHGEIVTVIKNEIHNERSSPDPYIKRLLTILIEDMKQLGTKTVNEYVRKKMVV